MSTERQTPGIACVPNGPYYLYPGTEPGASALLRRASGETLVTERRVALCRCGGSRNKPFCDGTHRVNGFTDARAAEDGANRRVSYAGTRITVHDNRAICAHSGVCTDRLQSVFRMRQEPWIDPDGASAQEIVETVAKCPSGALSYSVGSVEHSPARRAPLVTITDDGPYAISGGVELIDVAFGDGASTEHYTLCRCGASKNKPFCDGSHWNIGFHDPVR
jgi:CDGSH-type Zn-finger protein